MDLTRYYNEICKEDILTKDEEVALFAEFQDPKTSNSRKEAIRTRVINSNLRFAFREAKKFSKNDPGIFADLIGAANDGLVVGFEKYNPQLGYRFLSYAGWWIQQRILKEMSKMRIVSLPIWKQQLAAKILRLQDKNPNITLEQLKASLPDVSEKDIRELSQTRYLTYYIDDMDEDEFEIDVIGDQVQTKMDNDKVWKAVASLPSPHREIVARSSGLEDGKEHTPAEMARALKLPKEEVRRIRQEGLDMLKELLGKKEDYLDR